jgi:hypothetical protein
VRDQTRPREGKMNQIAESNEYDVLIVGAAPPA